MYQKTEGGKRRMVFDKSVSTELDNLCSLASENKLNYNMVLYAAQLAPLKSLAVSDIVDYLRNNGVSVIYDESLVEEDAPSEDVKPFDPSKVNIIEPPMTMDSLIKRIENDEIEFSSDFQRKAGLWDDGQKSRLIESVLLRIPLPAFYFDATDDDKWVIIDGLQRTTAIRDFIVNQSLALKKLEFFTDLNGKKFNDLPRSFQRRIEETHILAYKVCPPTPSNVKFNIFKRLNTSGLTLEPQEIRNALYQGSATKFLAVVSKSTAFVKATGSKVSSDRMLDREFVLRFIAFCYYGFDKYDGDIESFLNNTMDWLNKQSLIFQDDIAQEFDRVMELAYSIFGTYAFQKLNSSGRHNPINKAVFVDWCYVLHNIKGDRAKKLVQNKDTIKKMFTKLCETRAELWNSSSRSAMYTQFSIINTRIRQQIFGEVEND